MAGELETASKLLNGTSLNDLQWPFQGHHRQITWKWYNIQLYLQWLTNRKWYMIYRTALFSITLNDLYPQFQGHAILWHWISQKWYDITRYRHNVIEILIGTYTRPTQQCHFEWPWVTLQNIQWQEASHGFSATAELLVKSKGQGHLGWV